jgi:putative flavoprotein involved in K+ transport
LSRFAAALDRQDCAAAADLFGNECYWRDLISFTWNIKTLEGKDERVHPQKVVPFRG